MINIQKAAIIGCGFVGASAAFSLIHKGLFSELVLIDANHKKAEGEAMDLSLSLIHISLHIPVFPLLLPLFSYAAPVRSAGHGEAGFFPDCP